MSTPEDQTAIRQMTGEMKYSKQTYTYKMVKDCMIQADVYRQPGDEVRPVIIWIHGGALILGSRNSLAQEQLERYLQAGYVVVSIDYRLAPETKLAAIIEDLQDAYAWVRDKGPELFRIDPDRIAVIGHSAGGYLTLMAGFCVKPRPKALVSFYGYGDISGNWYARPDPFYLTQQAVTSQEANEAVGGAVISESAFSPRWSFYLYCRQHGLWPQEVTGHDPTTEDAAFEPFCPIRQVTQEYPPTLLLHGDRDTDVPFELSVQMAATLELHGVTHQLIRMEGYGHGFDGISEDQLQHLAKVIEAFDAVVAFLKEQVG